MKETGMIFNGEMVRAILDGRKTQTRRPVSQNLKLLGDGFWYEFEHKGLAYRVNSHTTTVKAWAALLQFCPYGQVGDRIYVREACYLFGRWTRNGLTKNGRQKWKFLISPCKSVVFEKPKNIAQRSGGDGFDGDYGFKYTPGMHMPRWASRITLEITDIRVDRLRDISEVDAKAEGVAFHSEEYGYCGYGPFAGMGPAHHTAQQSFASLWQSIYGLESWAANPWVLVIEFKQVT